MCKVAKVIDIFKFLKDFNELSNPVITEISRQKWSLRLSEIPQIEEIWSVYDEQNFDKTKLLEVIRPKLKPCPPPGKNIVEWIEGDWKKPNVKLIDFKDEITKEVKDSKGGTKPEIVNFFDDENRVNDFDDWLDKRQHWRAIEHPKQKGLNLYNRLFGLYSEIKKESESVELILGDGHIKWDVNGISVNHPVLLQKVHLRFNSEKPSFTIYCDDIKTELYSPMLRIIPTINQSVLAETIEEIEDKGYHIADIPNIIGICKRLIYVIDKDGKYVENNGNDNICPIIMQKPVLFLRKRNLGYSIFINKIIEDIDNDNVDFPDFLENMVGNYKGRNNSEVIEDDWNQGGMDEEVLLTLPANNEQLSVVKHLDDYGAVLVQGPPGTGKTHTIANLTGHFLSKGKSVLVTSHTEKALTVLKDKIYKELRSLCVSLLSSSSERKEMDSSLFEIAEKGDPPPICQTLR